MVKHQRVFVVLKTTSNAKPLFKIGAAPLYRSLVTSLCTVLGNEMNCDMFVFHMCKPLSAIVFRMTWLFTNYNIAIIIVVDGRGEDMATELWLPVHL